MATHSKRGQKTVDQGPFDKAYYDQYYYNSKTRIITPQAFKRQGDFVCAYVRYLEQPVRRVIDLGCGIGRWQSVIHDHFPRASYTGVEVSDYLCERHGWQQGSVVDYASRHPFDLVICQDVVQYLCATDATQAIDNLAKLCRGVLYFTCMTQADWENNCDQDLTDGEVELRKGSWYRKHLNKHFVNGGGGVYFARSADHVMFELECLE